MPDFHTLSIATALARVLEQMALASISTDAMTALRLASLASELRFGAPR